MWLSTDTRPLGRPDRRVWISGWRGQMRRRLRAYLLVLVAWSASLPGRGFRM